MEKLDTKDELKGSFLYKENKNRDEALDRNLFHLTRLPVLSSHLELFASR